MKTQNGSIIAEKMKLARAVAFLVGLSLWPIALFSPAQANPLPESSFPLAGLVPLTDQAMSTMSGTGLILTKANVPTQGHGTGNVVLWDEVARNPGNIPKTVPGFRVTVNGVAQ